MYHKLKSPDFIAQQQKDKTGSNNHMSKSVYLYKKIQNEYILVSKFDTIISVAKFIGCSKTTISRYCKTGAIYYPPGRREIKKEGFLFTFIKI